VGLALLAVASPANAATATFFSDHCTDLCGPQPTGFATITGTDQGGGVIDLTITPLNGNGLVNGGQTTFTFNLVGNPTITYSNLPSTFTVVNGFGAGSLSENAGAIGQNGFGTFEYGIDFTGVSGGSNPLFTPLSFTISGTGLTLASFAELSTIPPGDTQAFFALDIISGTTGNTGLVDVSGGPSPFGEAPPPAIPIPGAVWLFAGGLGLICMLYQKKEKPKSAWA
jgi:hypothetical protein